jgi:hypothetical protein
MRYIVSFLLSLLAVAVCILLFNQLFNQTIAGEPDTEEPDIIFVDKIKFTDNQACKQARIDINNYLKHPETACQVDQDCHFFKHYSMCGNAPVTNTAGNIKLNKLQDIADKNCIYIVHNIPMCIQTPFYGHQPVCLNNQCISLPEINDSLLNKQIHDTNQSLQNQNAY